MLRAYVQEDNNMSVNPYKPSVLFVGHGQTVQTHIRRRIMRRLIRVFTVYIHNVLLKINKHEKKIPRNKPENGNGLVQFPLDKSGEFHSA